MPYLDGHKSQLESSTIRSLIVGIVALVGAFGVKLAVHDEDVERIANGVMAAVPLVAMVMAWVGRVRAEEKIGPPPEEDRL